MYDANNTVSSYDLNVNKDKISFRRKELLLNR